MRILQIHTRYRQPGGEEAVARVEAQLLRRAGHEVVEYHVDNPQSLRPSAAALALSAWNPVAARRIADVARRARPDVAHVHNTWFALSPSIYPALRASGTPVVATLHNYRLMCSNGLLFRDGAPCEDCVGTHPWHGVRHRCYRDSALSSAAVAGAIAINAARGTWTRDVDAFVALTAFAKERFVAAGVPEERVRVKPNPVLDAGDHAARPSQSSTVLFVGRLSPEKGVGELLDAWVAQDRQPLRLDVVGDGPLRAELEQRAAGRVRFLGALPSDEVRRRMSQARALVFPSRWYETFGLVVVEAMSAGLPVIASNLGGIAELVSDEAGWLVSPPNSTTEWSRRLQVLQDGDAVDRAGRAARHRYESVYSEDAGLRALESVYESVLGTSAVARS